MPRRGENIYKRKDGRWEARYIKEISPEGKKKYGSVYAKSYKEVKTKQKECLLHLERNIYISVGLTVSELMSEWLDSIKTHVKATTYQKYDSINKNHITPIIGSVILKYVSNDTVRKFTEKLSENDKLLSSKTINDILVVLGLALKYAEEEYGTTLPKIPYLKEEKNEMRVLSLAEQQCLTIFLNKNMDIFKFGILLALYTGIRIGELCALQWNDITEEYIKINKTMTRVKCKNGKTEIKISNPKSESSRRLIPTPKCLIPLIMHYKHNGKYVLSTEFLQYTEPRLLQIKFKKMIADCGLEKVNFHALRHTFATRCVEAGIDVKTLSEMLGHYDVKTTLNRYVHSSFELKQKSMLQFEKSLSL